MPRFAIGALIAALAIGCMTPGQQRAWSSDIDREMATLRAEVRATSNPEAIKGCGFVQNVFDSSPDDTDGDVGHGVWSAEKSLLVKAKRAGGNALFVSTERFGFYNGRSRSGLRAEVYRCDVRLSLRPR